jgi:hypothetical protein
MISQDASFGKRCLLFARVLAVVSLFTESVSTATAFHAELQNLIWFTHHKPVKVSAKKAVVRQAKLGPLSAVWSVLLQWIRFQPFELTVEMIQDNHLAEITRMFLDLTCLDMPLRVDAFSGWIIWHDDSGLPNVLGHLSQSPLLVDMFDFVFPNSLRDKKASLKDVAILVCIIEQVFLIMHPSESSKHDRRCQRPPLSKQEKQLIKSIDLPFWISKFVAILPEITTELRSIPSHSAMQVNERWVESVVLPVLFWLHACLNHSHADLLQSFFDDHIQMVTDLFMVLAPIIITTSSDTTSDTHKQFVRSLVELMRVIQVRQHLSNFVVVCFGLNWTSCFASSCKSTVNGCSTIC